MKKIALTQGKYALVDDEDFGWLNHWKWHLVAKKYAARREYYKEDNHLKSRYIYMHRFIAQTPSDMDTDHRNGNGLDNRKDNLRVCTTAENLANRTKLTRNTTGYKGVIQDKKTGKFIAQIGWQRHKLRKNTRLGSFDTALDAAKAYELAASARYGRFARLEVLEGHH